MAVALCQLTWFAAQDGRRAGRDHHLDLTAVRGDRLVGGRTIVRGIRRYLNNGIIDLIEQWADPGWIIRILIGQWMRYYHAASRIHRPIQLAPRPSRLRAMLGLEPLSDSVDL